MKHPSPEDAALVGHVLVSGKSCHGHGHGMVDPSSAKMATGK